MSDNDDDDDASAPEKTPRYVLELLSYIEDLDARRRADGMYTHVGYATDVDPRTGDARVLWFSTKTKAAAYYDRLFGSSMRALNAHGNWTSDWDSITKHAYCVREDVGVGANFVVEPMQSEAQMEKIVDQELDEAATGGDGDGGKKEKKGKKAKKTKRAKSPSSSSSSSSNS
jgi:hypothetical protein